MSHTRSIEDIRWKKITKDYQPNDYTGYIRQENLSMNLVQYDRCRGTGFPKADAIQIVAESEDIWCIFHSYGPVRNKIVDLVLPEGKAVSQVMYERILSCCPNLDQSCKKRIASSVVKPGDISRVAIVVAASSGGAAAAAGAGVPASGASAGSLKPELKIESGKNYPGSSM